jgi:hypothetical protein
MRDGIPRTIPVPRKWQIFVECADRTADRGTQRVVDRLVDAVRHTFARYFPSEQRKILIGLADAAQSTLPGIAPPSLPEDKSHHLAELLTHAQTATRGGENFCDALFDSLAAKMESYVAAHQRQISEDLATKCRPNELQRVRAEMDRAALLFDARAEVRRILSPNNANTRPKIEPDEDLRK